MNVDTVSVSLIVKPFAFKDIAVNMPKFTLTAGFIKPPISFVFGTVFPDLDTVTVLEIA